jgi:hypothetical protein
MPGRWSGEGRKNPKWTSSKIPFMIPTPSEVIDMDDEHDRFEQFALEVIEVFEYAMDGNFSAMPDLEDLNWSVDYLTRCHGFNGTEPWILPLRRLISGPDVKSYIAAAQLLELFVARLYPPEGEENQVVNHDIPF